MESNEEWRDILGFEGAYQISNLGRVKSLDKDIHYMNHGTPAVLHKKGMILKQTPDVDGYLRVSVVCEGRSKNFAVHRLVAQAFISNPENLPCVNHKDYDKTNNCVDNLEWCTVEYNNKYSNTEERRPHSMYVRIGQDSAKITGHSVRCIETEQEFPSMIEAERQMHLWAGAVLSSVRTGYKVYGKYTFEKLSKEITS